MRSYRVKITIRCIHAPAADGFADLLVETPQSTDKYSRLHGTIPKTVSKEVALNILRISSGLTSRSLFVSVKGRQPRNIDLDCLQIPIASFPNCFMTKWVTRQKTF